MTAADLKIMEKTGSLKKDHPIKDDLYLRIRTVSGHLNGIEKMIAKEVYCVDILKQIAAVQSALSKIAMTLCASHMHHCVSSAIKSGEGEAEINELMETLKYLKHF